MRRRLLAVLALGLISCTVVPSTSAYIPGGKTWPRGTIRYYNLAADQAWPVERAVYVWNHSGARVRFVPSSQADAQLIIGHFTHRRCVGHALGTLGYAPKASVWLPLVDESSSVCNSYASVSAVAHELGHVLGLKHETRGCALMNPTGSWRGAKLCTSANPWEWRCEILEDDDVRGAVALYGGKVAVTPRNCPVYAAMSAPRGFAAQASADGSGVDLRFSRPELPKLPTFLAASARSEGGYGLAAELNRCPTDFRAARKYGWSVKSGAESKIFERLTPGRYCYAIWAFDQLGRPSERPVWAWAQLTSTRRA
jgi:hypothetical protein